MRRILPLLLLLVTAGCDAFLSVTCTTIAIPGINVYVRDAASGASTAAGATVVARSGAYTDSVTVPAPLTYDFPVSLALERPGYYVVTVRKAGYRDWSQSSVRVSADKCHVHTVTLTASLQPL